MFYRKTFNPMRYPAWFPYPSSWLNALFLALLSAGVVAVIRLIFQLTLAATATTNSVELFILGTIAALLIPIPIVALIHHLIHAGLTRFAPKLQAAEIGRVRGALPGLMSWWEALWSWLVFVLSTVLAVGAIVIAAPLLGVDWNSDELDEYERLSGVTATVWLTSAACLYQIAYLVERRLRWVAKQQMNSKQNF